ncbi:MAG: Flagellar hook-length control protein FliK [Thermoleophilia bacterium]|nr:Flagellar hook-length control protein FliK [Thermoleophilia bacterium]
MRTEKPEGPQEPNNRRKHKAPGGRPKRTGTHGPVGFGHVMRDVRGGGKQPGQHGGGTGTGTGTGHGDGSGGHGSGGTSLPGTATLGSAGFDPALAQAQGLDAGARAARAMGAVPTDGERLDAATFGVRDATDALHAQDQSVAFQSSAQPLVPTPLARMTPSALLETVLDESTRLAIDEASKELHVELEPAHLGPLTVRLKREPDGRLDIRFRARQGDAARVLEQGTELLRERLAAAGYANVTVDVTQDSSLQLTGVTSGR